MAGDFDFRVEKNLGV